jgi:hypothetical protein
MRRHFRLSLRDVLWLTLLVAAVVAALQTHYRDQQELLYWQQRQFRPFYVSRPSPGYYPQRNKSLQAERKELQSLSDEKLLAMLNTFIQRDRFEPVYEYCLSEAARRKLAEPLAQYFSRSREADALWRSWDEVPQTLAELTALRRAAEQRDPLKIEAWVDRDADAPALRVQIENVDVGQEAFLVTRLGSPRNGHWRLVMTDLNGEPAAVSNYELRGLPFLHPPKILAPGEKAEWTSFDLRQFVAPPPSGVYRVQLFYDDLRDIGSQRDLDGLIYFQSAPLTIRVRNPDNPPRLSLEGAIPLTVAILPVGLLASGWVIARRTGNRALVVRDFLWCLVILSVGIAWFADQQHLWQQIREAIPHENAIWTIEAVEG